MVGEHIHTKIIQESEKFRRQGIHVTYLQACRAQILLTARHNLWVLCFEPLSLEGVEYPLVIFVDDTMLQKPQYLLC